MVFANIGLVLLSILLFLFIFWKRLKEDYSSHIIFSAGFLIIFFRFIFWLISRYQFSDYWFWISLLGTFIALGVAIYKYKMRFYETFESFVIASIPTLSLIFLDDSIKNSSIVSFAAFLFTLLLIFVFTYLDLNYKSFSWYKSGKIGLAGIVVFTTFFLGRIAVSLFNITLVSLSGSFELYFSAFVVIMGLWQLYLIQRT